MTNTIPPVPVRYGISKSIVVSYNYTTQDENGTLVERTAHHPILVREATLKDEFERGQLLRDIPEEYTENSPLYFLWFQHATLVSCSEFIGEPIPFDLFLSLPVKSISEWERVAIELNPDWFPHPPKKDEEKN